MPQIDSPSHTINCVHWRRALRVLSLTLRQSPPRRLLTPFASLFPSLESDPSLPARSNTRRRAFPARTLKRHRNWALGTSSTSYHPQRASTTHLPRPHRARLSVRQSPAYAGDAPLGAQHEPLERANLVPVARLRCPKDTLPQIADMPISFAPVDAMPVGRSLGSGYRHCRLHRPFPSIGNPRLAHPRTHRPTSAPFQVG